MRCKAPPRGLARVKDSRAEHAARPLKQPDSPDDYGRRDTRLRTRAATAFGSRDIAVRKEPHPWTSVQSNSGPPRIRGAFSSCSRSAC
ncbi:hypothetical protein PUN4_130066 [Paraburkholderia unamae]|nr:hypothetical protein PUN4_130066 [Paraburkholderia unamae]